MKKILLIIAMFLHALCANAQGVPSLADPQESAKIAIDDDLYIDEQNVDAFGETIKIQPQIVSNNKKYVAPQQAGNTTINSKKSLTDNFKTKSHNDNEESNAEGESADSSTWIGSGFSALKELAGKPSKDNPLSTAMEQSKGLNKKSMGLLLDLGPRELKAGTQADT